MSDDPFADLGRRMAGLIRERVAALVEDERTEAARLAAELDVRATQLEAQVKTLAELDGDALRARAKPRKARSGAASELGKKPRAKPVRRVTSGSFRLAAYLEEVGLTVIDKRSVPGGNLWAVGDPAVASQVLAGLEAEGIDFIYVPNGSRATGGKPGWYTKSPK